MRARYGFTLASLVTLAVALPAAAVGQQVDSSRVAVGRDQNVPGLVVVPPVTPGSVSRLELAGPLAASDDRKDPTLAGVLSFLIPGLGSFYAGNNTHGVIHLGVHLGSYVLMIGGLATDAYSGGASNAGLAGAGALVLIGNDIWSIFTAVNDAHAHNGGSKPGRVVGTLYLQPDIRRFPSPATSLPTAPKTELQLLQWRF